ncbi:MAG: hypothetical protein ABI833_18320 [Acidobacteriota bacterium]
MRVFLLMIFAMTAWAQASATSEQQPHYQPGWPCTGKERSFDPTYSKIAEATGGHLFLLDKSEVAGTSALVTGDMQHKDTLVRASGKLESYIDIPIPVDASVDSLFVVASLQCMQTILLYDPQRSGVNGAPDQDHWFRAGRTAIILKPVAGEWLLRLAGTGAYSVAVQAHATLGMHSLQLDGSTEKTVVLQLSPQVANPQFRLVSPTGQPVQTLALEPDPNSPGRFRGTFQPPAAQFRVQVEDGAGFQRVDPRLFEAKPYEARPGEPKPVQ